MKQSRMDSQRVNGDELTMKHLLVCPIEDGQAACECGDELTMKHLLVCPIEDGQAACECGYELTLHTIKLK